MKGGGGGAASQRRAKDARMASNMKAMGVERHTGMCPICYKSIPNDTLGGSGAYNHYSAHARGAKGA